MKSQKKSYNTPLLAAGPFILSSHFREVYQNRHWFSLIEGRKLYWVGVREKRSQYKLRRK
jgi:hypothetical protein